MTPRKFDRYMVAISIGTHPKLGELSDGEFRAHVAGVLAVAAMAPVRGLLMVGALPAKAVHVARAAGVSKTVAQSAIDKLVEVGILERDDEHECLRVHDWEDYNPPPKTDASNAERQARYRSRNAPRNGGRNAPRNDDVTPHVTDTEVEVEVEVEELQRDPKGSLSSSSELDRQRRADLVETFAYWQERCRKPRAKLTAGRRRHVTARLNEGYSIHDIRRGIDGAASNPPVNRDDGTVYDELESICRNGAQLERYMERAEPRVRAVPNRPYQRPNASEMLRAINGGAA